MLDGVTARLERERDLAAWTAWKTASLTMTAFHSPKKFPKLETVLPKKKRPARRQGWEEQKSIVMMMNAMFGGEVKKRT